MPLASDSAYFNVCGQSQEPILVGAPERYFTCVGSYLTQQTLYYPGTSTLAYYENSKLVAVKSSITLAQVPHLYDFFFFITVKVFVIGKPFKPRVM